MDCFANLFLSIYIFKITVLGTEMKLSFTPLAFCRPFLGKCFFDDNRRLECYRQTRYYPRLVAFRNNEGTWYIRRKYRLIYSENFLLKLLKTKQQKEHQ